MILIGAVGALATGQDLSSIFAVQGLMSFFLIMVVNN